MGLQNRRSGLNGSKGGCRLQRICRPAIVVPFAKAIICAGSVVANSWLLQWGCPCLSSTDQGFTCASAFWTPSLVLFQFRTNLPGSSTFNTHWCGAAWAHQVEYVVHTRLVLNVPTTLAPPTHSEKRRISQGTRGICSIVVIVRRGSCLQRGPNYPRFWFA